ncbi:MAGUK p55 subfamily member 7 [Hemibagrus wyckioides]|uniref:MAGUK p55 subfamily member 7 n=1 Tax=Hemibagrus wyckioides TaxID=337641 RepID=UPI00266D86D8|nr:MAGUK p55 subfamily member 7 [Hemibagrus wyckioides]
MKELHALEARPEIKELMHVLSKPHVQDLLSVHDSVAQNDYEPRLPLLAADDDEDEEDSVRIIQMMKSKEPLGATVKRDKSTGALVVARVMRGGAADRVGLIHEGDELREVNGVLMQDKKPEEIIPILAQSDRAVTFKVIPGTKGQLEPDNTEVFVRAMFDYHPEKDSAIPCKEAGLEFWRGDVLQILSQEDDTWWQASRVADANPRAGLIPSRQLQERRVVLRRPEALFQTSRALTTNSGELIDADYVAIHGIHMAGLRRSFRLSKKDHRRQEMQAKWKKSEVDGENHISSYQEVVPYVRQPGEPYRLVLLVDTTRERRRRERDGVDYHFISKHAFESDILHHKFIEYGEHGGKYYGTSLDSVRKVLAESKVCLLDVEPDAVKLLYTTEFKPYVTFIKPPAIEQLRLSRRKARILASCDEAKPTRTFMEADFEEMINTAQDMEDKYGYLFEKIIINDDLATVFTALRAELKKLEKESNWIPKIWP